MQIKVDSAMRHYTTGDVFTQSSFTLGQQYGFMVIPPVSISQERITTHPTREISTETQQELLDKFVAAPLDKLLTIVGTSVSSKVPRYFATWMAAVINKARIDAEPIFVDCRDAEIDDQTGLFYFPELKSEKMPSVLVLLMGETMTQVQCIKVQDLVAKWGNDCPVIVQVLGNPIEAALKLHIAAHRVFYLGPCNETQVI